MFFLGCIIRKHFLTDIELANFSLLSATSPRNIWKEHVLVYWYYIAHIWNAQCNSDYMQLMWNMLSLGAGNKCTEKKWGNILEEKFFSTEEYKYKYKYKYINKKHKHKLNTHKQTQNTNTNTKHKTQTQTQNTNTKHKHKTQTQNTNTKLQCTDSLTHWPTADWQG